MHWFTHMRMAVTLTLGFGFSLLLGLYEINQGLADFLQGLDQPDKSPRQTYMQARTPQGQVPPPTADPALLKAKYQRPGSLPFPGDNTHSEARALLGQMLFFDPRLSGSNWIACATCHNPGLAWGDGLPRAIGHGMQVLGRRTPTILNVAWADQLFWDGRAASLEEQALGPIQAPGEMNQPMTLVLDKLQGIAGYRELFQNAYPNEPLSAATVAKAIATFERTVVSGLAPFDRWVAGEDHAISDAAKRG